MMRQIASIYSRTIACRIQTKKYQFLNMVSAFKFAQKKQQINPLTVKFSQMGSAQKTDDIVSNGRAWMAYELRIKSTQDLHKLWYVCVRQKNILKADQVIQLKNNYKDTCKNRLFKLKKTMSRILTVIDQRSQIRKQYRQKLQKQYIQQKRSQLQKQLEKQPQPLPQITWQLLRTKYHQLRKGIDNVEYLQRIWQHKDMMQGRKQRGQIRSQQLTQSKQKFSSFWQRQMTYEQRPTQEEVLRAHVTNWKSLNLKQRKIILGFLNAKRSRDAKKQFVKELKVLGQKLVHQQVKQRAQVK